MCIIVDNIDSNKDGFITEDELKVMIRDAQKKHTSKQVERQWNDSDVNNDSLIGWYRFKNVTYGSYMDNPQIEAEYNFTHMMLRDERRFRVADRNRDSSADKLQFTAFLYPESYEHMQDVVVQETIDDINKSGDGFIDLNEYIEDNVKDPDWVETERQQFSELRDKDKDGKMDRQETMEWILPSDSIHAEFGAKHLLSEFDTN
ncbi:LOW QUALITY PROTEIN: calumenin-A-like [Scophthalmus maximus]|uniref:LOW QUALITY PROTEIN: calumenin-A n=1 Tax=Scophthalmus maximus TaxID=52904 RepID=UPI001FA8FB4A|nr:LOW QUALITY PROTEIN: calumenin-A [Scophthalmus maximus]XP_047192324.1 LOW QUALITY PROTEIN: calumenin-A-like [Scophthalmus maximus]